MQRIQLTINNPAGLHARPAAALVQLAAKFKSRVTISARDKTADAKSILSVMGLGLKQGDSFVLAADGPDEDECLQALNELVAQGFNN
ncbi:HPr family phosphocarrier protein [Sporolituus thermophilus]|uniref:Phosphocarrier protein HPr n=1 Tax=Sporolituus thermophilus DSM 23256 TaxID=1123285 RepID=A0A1G7L9E5_9FIRM|nr:HPr family phosphocarrier protein [Sporolituus thermophilus]SDF45991.1 phosphocarrier protein [Sporolituus thermophilus DSM 23256]